MTRHRVCAVIEAGGVRGRNPLLGPLAHHLARRGMRLATWDPTVPTALPPKAPPADVYLLKADDAAAISAAVCLADVGAVMLNQPDATLRGHDKVRLTSRLLAAGLPLPRSFVVSERDGLARLLADGPMFVKPVRGSHGVGAARLAASDVDRAGPGPWLVQEVVGTSDEVIKAYGVGPRIALRRMRFVAGVVDGVRTPVYDAELEELAVRAAEVAELECFGVDFVATEAGAVIVDVNAFPGYRSVPEAPGWIADEIASLVGRAA